VRCGPARSTEPFPGQGWALVARGQLSAAVRAIEDTAIPHNCGMACSMTRLLLT
jgi:hypothetical protein